MLTVVRNRIALIFYLLAIFLDVGVSCNLYDEHLLFAPTPCKKTLWEAQTQKAWELEYDVETFHSLDAPQMTCARLMNLHYEFGVKKNSADVMACAVLRDMHAIISIEGDKFRREALDKVYADADGLGNLILLAANLI